LASNAWRWSQDKFWNFLNSLY